MIKSSMNCMGVAVNPWQGMTTKVLCVCSAGILRSATMADVLSRKYGFNTRNAGTEEEYALVPLSTALVAWADYIFCAESYQKTKLIKEYVEAVAENGGCDVDDPAMVDLKDRLNNMTYVLGISDEYGYSDPGLIKTIESRLENYIHENGKFVRSK